MNFKFFELFSSVTGEIARLEEQIHAKSVEDRAFKHVFIYVTDPKGKLLRPKLLFLLCKLKGVPVTDEIISAGLVIELLHTASLLHDDIIDQETVRRNRPSSNVVFGNAKCLLAGDYLLAKSFEILIKMKNPAITRICVELVLKSCRGEMTSTDFNHPHNITLRKYYSSIEGKTASFFSACSKIVNLYTKKSDASLEKFTRLFGTLYQVFDDVVDTEKALNSKRQCTLREIVSLPIMYAMRENPRLFGGKIISKNVLSLLQKTRSCDTARTHLKTKYRAQIRGFQKVCDPLYQILSEVFEKIAHHLTTFKGM